MRLASEGLVMLVEVEGVEVKSEKWQEEWFEVEAENLTDMVVARLQPIFSGHPYLYLLGVYPGYYHEVVEGDA